MQMRPNFGLEEKKAICDYLDEDGFMTEFKRTALFEKMLADFTGAKHCIVVNNGTVSLTLAALALNISHGDEVIVPNYTMIATPNSVKLLGAKPVFVDVERETLCMDFEKMKLAVTKKTKAIILVTANGRYPHSGIDQFSNFARINGIKLIEDAAQSLGSYYPNKLHIGTVGEIGSFSFSAPKIISTGQGGALITNDDELADKIRKLKDFGRSGGGNDIHDSIGFNFKFTELQACLGIEQLKKLEYRVNKKKEMYQKYKDALFDIPDINLFDNDIKNTSPWFIDITANKRDDLSKFLKLKNIGTREMYGPINKQLAYKIPGSFPVADYIGQYGLWLPSSVDLSDDEIDYIADSIRSFYKYQ